MESKSQVFLDDWRCSHPGNGKIAGQWFPPNRKKASSETFAATVPNWDVSRKPEGWPRGLCRTAGQRKSGKACKGVAWNFLKLHGPPEERGPVGVVFGVFWGWWRGGLYSFCRFGQKFDVVSHQQSLFVGRKLKDGSFNTRQRWLF